MAYAEKCLHRITQAPVGATTGSAKQAQISKWLYGTDDAAAVVETAGYFNSARSLLSVGDQIEASMAVASSAVSKDYVVTAVPASGNVTIALKASTAG